MYPSNNKDAICSSSNSIVNCKLRLNLLEIVAYDQKIVNQHKVKYKMFFIMQTILNLIPSDYLIFNNCFGTKFAKIHRN